MSEDNRSVGTRIIDLLKASKSLATGLGITLKYVPRDRVTLQYPEEKPALSDRYRGALMLKGVVGEDRQEYFTNELQSFNATIKDRSEKDELPPCVGTCPAHTDARGYVSLIAERRFDDALDLIRERCTLPASLGRICHHPCETKCRRGYYDESVAIRTLKRFATDVGEERPHPEAVPKTKKGSVAIIGGGPAGLTAALDLARQGYPVTIFDKNPSAGGALLTGVPKYRLPKEKLAWDVDSIASVGVEIKTGVEVGKDISFQQIADEHDAVLLAVGLSVSRGLPIPGMDAKEGVLLALPFLRSANLDDEPMRAGKKTIVIGGGNVAIDVARVARRVGGEEVHLFCLESRCEMPAFSWEIEEAVEEGVILNPSWGPQEILVEDGKVTGMKFKRCSAVFDAEGRFNPTFCEEETNTLDADCVIISIGQGGELSFLKDSEVQVDERGRLGFDRDTHQTNVPKVFACGEIVTGPGSAVGSIATGHEAAVSIDRFLSGKDLKEGRVAPMIPDYEGPYQNVYLVGVEEERRRAEVVMEDPEERIKDFREIEHGWDEETAVKEAYRSLCCKSDACIGCTFCARICPDYAIQVERKSWADAERGIVRYDLDLAKCMFCGLCAEQCPTKALVMSKDFELAKYQRPSTIFDREVMLRYRGNGERANGDRGDGGRKTGDAGDGEAASVEDVLAQVSKEVSKKAAKEAKR